MTHSGTKTSQAWPRCGQLRCTVIRRPHPARQLARNVPCLHPSGTVGYSERRSSAACPNE